MKTLNLRFTTLLCTALAVCLDVAGRNKPVLQPVDYVSTLVGSLSEPAFSTGNTYPAIAMPWGMNFWTPQTGKMGDGWIYNYTDHTIRGFKQTHQPSPWINDYGQFALMPVTGEGKINEEARQSWFTHQSEEAHPYYYKVYLADPDVTVEITPTERAAVMRFTFPECSESGIVVDAFDHGSQLQIIDNQTVIGYTTRNSGGVPANFKNYFVIRFDKPIGQYRLYDGKRETRDASIEGDHAQGAFYFTTRRGEQVSARVASSFISSNQALRNLDEVADRTFEEVKHSAATRWNEVLGRIELSGGSEEQYRTFYSCLYRATLFPRKFYEMDANGKAVHYSPFNGRVETGYLYTDNGFWDTFRALFPLLNLVYPSVNAEIQAGLANVYRESGFLPEWASPGHRNCMVGNNSASIVSDAILKGITPPKDVALLYQAMMHSRTAVHPSVGSTGRLGYEYYNRLGYIPCDVGINESAARTLEYAYDDWCIAQVARKLGHTADIGLLDSAALNYRNLFDRSTRLMRGRKADGSFETPFSPYKWGGVFTEGNAWHYTWSVFHDVAGLARLMGGHAEFRKMLDSVFVVPPIYDDSYYGTRIHEITEMQVAHMGNYAHGNQPAQHMTYLYDYVGQPWKTQYWVREVMNRLYSAKPDGYCGDEDNGQTSAWYVFSAMGFYPVCPASDEYALGAPLFGQITIHLDNGRRLSIECTGNTDANRYIGSATLNGRNWPHNYLPYDELVHGAKIRLKMQAEPETSRGINATDAPVAAVNAHK